MRCSVDLLMLLKLFTNFQNIFVLVKIVANASLSWKLLVFVKYTDYQMYIYVFKYSSYDLQLYCHKAHTR
jgi:hypothetical protein